MVREKSTRELKVAGGIALRGSVWAEIAALAEAEGQSRNSVLETLVTIGLSHVRVSRKLGKNTSEVGSK